MTQLAKTQIIIFLPLAAEIYSILSYDRFSPPNLLLETCEGLVYMIILVLHYTDP